MQLDLGPPASHGTTAAVDDSGPGATARTAAPRAAAPAGIDLAVPPGTTSAPGSTPAPAAGVSLEEDDWDEQEALDVGLDMGSVAPPPVSAPVPSTGSMPAAGSLEPATAVPSDASIAPTSQAAPAVADEQELRRLAAYGPNPPHLLAALPYAWRVFQRRRELRTAVMDQQRLHGEVCRALREELVGVVDEVMRGVDDREAMAPLLAPIAEAEALATTSSEQLAATAGQFAARFEGFERKLAEAHAGRKQALRDRDLAQIHLEDCQQKRSHARADLRRADELLQAAHDAAAAAAGRGAEYAPPEHARLIAQREADRQPLADRLRSRERAAADAAATLKQRERGVKAAVRTIAALVDARAAMQTEATTAHHSSIAQLERARDRRLDAYQSVLRRLEADHPKLLDSELRQRVATVRQKLAGADAELDLHRRAVDAYDHDGYRRGVIVAAAIGVVLLLLLLTTVRVGGA